MKIEHIARYVEDLKRSRQFFETYFHAVSNDMYYNKKKEFRSYFLRFSDGTRLELMNRKDMKSKGKRMIQNGFAHIAFSTGSREKVDELTEKLKQDGFRITSGPRMTGDGYYESCILDWEGNEIEITV